MARPLSSPPAPCRRPWTGALSLVGLFLLLVLPVAGHEMRPAYLAITQVEPETYEVSWKVPALGSSQRMALYVRFDDRVETLGEPTSHFADGSFVERWRIQRPGGLTGSTIRIDGLTATFTDVLVRASWLDGTTQTVLLKPDQPSFEVTAAPVGWTVARTYFRLGVEHILLGVDHLLFVLGLLLLVDRRWMLFKTITSFTIAHSLTLGLSTFAIISVPATPLNAAIALSILFLGPEIVRKWRGGTSLTIRHPWVVAFAFGLLHGFGFAGALSAVGLPSEAVPAALLFFNLGVEAGQLIFIAILLSMVRVLARLRGDLQTWLRPGAAYGIGTLAAFWTLERTAAVWL